MGECANLFFQTNVFKKANKAITQPNFMKALTSILLLFTCFSVTSQNITQLRTFPVNPTANDIVLLIADLQFRTSGCVLDTKFHQVNGNSIVASTQHCVGVAQAICNTTDTFVLGVLTPGRYTVNLTLNTGARPTPCTPGIVPSDSDTLSFVVQTTLGIQDQVLPSFTIYPNPAKDFIVLSEEYQKVVSSLKVFNVAGAVVLESETPKERIDVSQLTPGVYTMELHHNAGVITEKFIKD